MRPIPVTKEILEVFGPEAVTKVWNGPGGILDTEIPPVEAVHWQNDQGQPYTSVVIALEDLDLAELRNGVLVIGWPGTVCPVFMQPFAIHYHDWVQDGELLICTICDAKQEV